MIAHRRNSVMLAAFILPVFLNGVTSADPIYFTGLGDLTGGAFESRAYGISADGSVVVGSSRSASGDQAFRWTVGGGMSGLGFLPGGTTSTAYGVSGDGSVIVGSSGSFGGMQAFRWTIGNAMFGLGGTSSVARAVSADGQIVVGQRLVGSGNASAFRWSPGQGSIGLPEPVQAIETNAFATSADGTFAVGDYTNDNFFGTSLRWTSQGGTSNFDTLPGADSHATAISSDGSVVAGTFVRTGRRAFRWTSTTGTVDLGIPPGVIGSSFAFGISGDGLTIVGGAGTTTNNSVAFIWDSTNGMRTLSELLVNDLGLDLTGWTLRPASGVSADGLTIVGSGVNPSGNVEAWIAHIPEPTTLSHLVLAGIVILARRRSPRRIS